MDASLAMSPGAGRLLAAKPVLVTTIVALLLALASSAARAYPSFTTSGYDPTPDRCSTCHGDFRANPYTDRDGVDWGTSLHGAHTSMIDTGCNTCHPSGAGTLPVSLASSDGGSGLGCAGCHGRTQDDVAGNPEVDNGGSGLGAGLRRHHDNAGATECAGCHDDAAASSGYTPVGEDILPPTYSLVNPTAVSCGDGVCNAAAGEDAASCAVDCGAADAGVDAGAPDGGSNGMPDAGTPDAGTPDAGTPDAGTPDAGTPDAGTPDAGTPDAGTPDAGTPDAGTGGSGGGGCGCRMAPKNDASAPMLIALLLLGTIAIRWRRKA